MNETPTTVLRIGLPIQHDGDVFTVVEISGPRLLLRRHGDGQVRQVDVGWLMCHPTTSVAAALDPPPAAGITLGTLDAPSANELSVRVAHVQELLTGYTQGCPELAADGEPRPGYGPGVALMDRYRAKAAELGVGISTLRRWVAAF